jgi:hypothetical protein
MSVALYVALERDLPGFDASSVCGKFLSRAQKKLDGIARRQGLTPLEDFVSMDPEEVRDLLDGLPEGLTEQWFEPAEGLKTVRGLLHSLRQDPSGVRNAREVCADLEATEQVLAAALSQGVRFHLAVDF